MLSFKVWTIFSSVLINGCWYLENVGHGASLSFRPNIRAMKSWKKSCRNVPQATSQINCLEMQGNISIGKIQAKKTNAFFLFINNITGANQTSAVQTHCCSRADHCMQYRDYSKSGQGRLEPKWVWCPTCVCCWYSVSSWRALPTLGRPSGELWWRQPGSASSTESLWPWMKW